MVEILKGSEQGWLNFEKDKSVPLQYLMVHAMMAFKEEGELP